MKRKLTLAERFGILGVLPDKGNFVTMRTLRDLREVLMPSDAEVSKYKIKQVGQQIQWNQKFRDITKEFDLGKTATRIIEDRLEELDKNKELTPNLISVFEKFVKSE